MRSHLIQKRKEHKTKQGEVATFLNVTTRHHQVLEAGTSEGSVPIWKKLAQRFNTTIDCLLAQAEETTQGNYNSSGQNGVAEAKQPNGAVQDFMIDVKRSLISRKTDALTVPKEERRRNVSEKQSRQCLNKNQSTFAP